ncbi:hypothetical protein Hanom_Chr09g00846441 [Helianthus anomalus]
MRKQRLHAKEFILELIRGVYLRFDRFIKILKVLYLFVYFSLVFVATCIF